MSRLRVYLTLGRISNLPTVWSNVLAGAVLSGASLRGPALTTLLVAVSLLYTGGMFLNDAFDREYDARAQPFRPIPAGLISAPRVFAIGFGLMGVGCALFAIAAQQRGTMPWGVLGAVALSSAIVIYDLWHKQNPFSPQIMGLCRALVYVSTALCLGSSRLPFVLLGAALLFLYLNVLTAIAKRGAPGKVVARLIAGISIVDAACIATAGQPVLAAAAVLGFPLTLLGQRYVRGT
jgi:4-hydroxybenzoate polyprenyltransferase